MLGGAKLNQALVRNVRTYTAMLKGKGTSGSNCEAESTDPDVHGLRQWTLMRRLCRSELQSHGRCDRQAIYRINA